MREIVEAIGISHGLVFSVLNDRLDIEKLFARWVLRLALLNSNSY